MSESEKTGSDASNQSKGMHKDPPTILEWSARLTSALLVALLFGYLVAHGFDDDRAAAFDFAIDADTAEGSGNLWRTPVTVTNVGGTGVEELKIFIEVPGTDQSFTVLIPQIGPAESYDLTLFLQRDPRQTPPDLRVESFH